MLANPAIDEAPHDSAVGGPALRVHLFGQMVAIDAQGKSVLPRARKTRALLAVLALSAPRPVLRAHLTSLLWSQREKEQARASLRQAVHELQEALGSASTRMMIAERNHVSMLKQGLWVDVLDLGRSVGTTEQLLDLFQSALLEDLAGLDPAFDRWLVQERDRLGETAKTIAENMLVHSRTPGDILKAAERLLHIDPVHEGAWIALIRTHAAKGDRGAALASFERCRASLAERARLAPGRAILDLIATIRGEAKSEPPASMPAVAPAIPPATPAARPRAMNAAVRLGVMPIRALDQSSGDGLAIGLTDEIANGLSRFRGISCVPMTSGAFQSGANMAGAPDRSTGGTEPAAWQRLNLDFLFEGTVQRYARHVRIMARLIDIGADGEVIWSHKFDLDEADILAAQDEIASQIVAQIDPRILLRQGERAAALQLDSATPHELLLQSIPAVYRLERKGFAAAGSHLEAAVSEDPNNAAAHAWYAYWHLFQVGQGWATDPDASSTRAAELAGRAVTLDSGDARSLTLAGHVRGFLGKQAEEACTLHARAIALNPNLALAWCFSGLAQCYRGNHAEALRLIRQAIRLSPYDPHLFFFDMALTMPHLLRGEYEEAVEIGRQAIELNPGFTSSYKGHLAALGHLGRMREATQIRETLLSLEPRFSVRQAIARSPMQNAEDKERYAEGLRRAGLPE